MNKFIKITLGLLGVILLGIGLLVITFLLDMKPDKDEEEKVTKQAKQYLEGNFNGDFEIYDTLYDNMGNFEFEYAAKVRDKKTGTEFLVYVDGETNQMVDTYIADKWAKEMKAEIRPFVKEKWGDSADAFVYFTDEKIGAELGIDPLDPKSYKEFDITATIRISVPRKWDADDEKHLEELISTLKNEDILQHGTVIIEYIAKNGAILDEEWGKEF